MAPQWPGSVAHRHGPDCAWACFEDRSFDLSILTAGVRVQYVFGPEDWDTRPFIGFDGGYARLSSDGITFSTADHTKANGWLMAPEVGLWSMSDYAIGFRVSARLQYVASREELFIGEHRNGSVSGLGVGLGVYYRF